MDFPTGFFFSRCFFLFLLLRYGLPNASLHESLFRVQSQLLGGLGGLVDTAPQGAPLVLGLALGELLGGALLHGGDGGPLVDADATVGGDDVLHYVPDVLGFAPGGGDGYYVALPEGVAWVVD